MTERISHGDHRSAEPELSVVIPVYDEAPSIADVAQRLGAWLATRAASFELWLIDDGSTDGTGTILEHAATAQPGLCLDGFRLNRGRGAALRRGLSRARAPVVLTTEADLSWGFDTLERLEVAVRSGGADVAVASPHRAGGRLVNVPLSRRALSVGANQLARLALGRDVTMATGATRAYRRDVLRRILSPLDGKAFHLDTLCRALRAGCRID
ncbi:MAG: glycosyltransferase family 2 protein, partial [Deltaproteobacteria bacterium]|nr:glycosyltransferase family 2 protein [Deltaproteobacteria bacterium]MBW2537020.1 glycosyltransferase family 2 protein [Deltaproteobacteria bacterium]